MISLLPPPDSKEDILNWLNRLYFWLTNLHMDQMLCGSAVWAVSSIADGDEEAKEVTITGAALGDYVLASLSVDIADLVLNAQVTAANTITCILANNTGGAIDLADTTVVYVMVIKKSH